MEFIMGGIELIDKIEEMWSKLNTHHSSISPFFKGDFNNFRFTERKQALIEKAKSGRIRIALFLSDNKPQGYCIASVEDKEGEIDSIYINNEYRKKGIGSRLMSECMDWLKENGSERIKVAVVYGNEDAHGFYGKFGLFPRVTYLTTLNWHTGRAV